MTESMEAGQPATWEELALLEKDFDEVDTEVLRHQNVLQAPLYKKRSEILSRTPEFWPTAFQSAPPEVESYVQMSDIDLIGHIVNLDVTRFEIPPHSDAPGGNPRSLSFRFEFRENEYIEDKVLEKKFWFRRTKDFLHAGLVSEPVKITWKKGKDLTEGLTDAAVAAWEAEKKSAQSTTNGANGDKKKTPLPEQQALAERMRTVSDSSVSFFAWFAFRGRHVSAEESAAANKKDAANRELIRQGKEAPKVDDAEYPDPDEINLHEDMEVFPDGEELAIALSDDLWANALKFYTETYDESGDESGFEEDLDSDEIFDLEKLLTGGKDNDDEGSDNDDDAAPAKKRRRES
ncbi:MAG: hypothetical protein M4579_006287 [Chaenotheca gracillima]|nr:MAG: hypothetical protein M4579_006287 [Chaenotheca gracillima]